MIRKALRFSLLLLVLLVAGLPLCFPVVASANSPTDIPAATSWEARDAVATDMDLAKAMQPEGVVVTSLKARVLPDGVLLTWETANESSILGFNIFRRVSSTLQAGWNAEGYGVLNQDFIFAQYAGANQGTQYSYKDTAVEPGMTCEYALQVTEADGRSAVYRMEPVMTRWWLRLPAVVR